MLPRSMQLCNYSSLFASDALADAARHGRSMHGLIRLWRLLCVCKAKLAQGRHVSSFWRLLRACRANLARDRLVFTLLQRLRACKAQFVRGEIALLCTPQCCASQSNTTSGRVQQISM